jgi:hypothetical protein
MYRGGGHDARATPAIVVWRVHLFCLRPWPAVYQCGSLWDTVARHRVRPRWIPTIGRVGCSPAWHVYLDLAWIGSLCTFRRHGNLHECQGVSAWIPRVALVVDWSPHARGPDQALASTPIRRIENRWPDRRTVALAGSPERAIVLALLWSRWHVVCALDDVGQASRAMSGNV